MKKNGVKGNLPMKPIFIIIKYIFLVTCFLINFHPTLAEDIDIEDVINDVNFEQTMDHAYYAPQPNRQGLGYVHTWIKKFIRK